MKRYLPLLIIAGVALITLAGGAILYWARQPLALPVPPETVAGDAAQLHVRGNPKAPVTLVEFGDFQCPPCRYVAGFLDELVAEYHPKLQLVFRNFPLSRHQHAREAALAAEAAGLQGKFWEMHDLLYQEQPAWSAATDSDRLFAVYAEKLGLNREQFRHDLSGEKAKARLGADVDRGNSLGIKTTPTIYINDRPVVGDQNSPNGIRAMIDAAVTEKAAK